MANFLAGSSYIVIHESGTYMVRNVITYANNNETWQLKKEWVSRIVRKENGYKWSVNKKMKWYMIWMNEKRAYFF